MSASDIQATMSTKIKVDQQEAANQVENLTNKFKDLTAQWKAEQATAKASGDSVGAAKARYEGLSKALEVQRQKVEQLNRQREDQQRLIRLSATVTKDQTDELAQLDKELTSATNKLTSLSNQQTRAKRSFEYASSGLKELRNEYYTNNRAVDSHIEKLKAEGNTAEAQKVKLAGLKSSLVNLAKQQEATKKLADEAAKSEGKNSATYRRRITDYNEVSATLSKTSKRYDELRAAEIKAGNVSTGGLAKMRDRFLGVYSAEKQATTQAKTMGEVMKGSFLGTFASNLAQNAIMAITEKMHGLIEAGKQYNVEQDTMKTVWHSLTTQAPRDGQQMLDFINKLSQHSIYSSETVNKLAQSFYHVDSSVKHAKDWTNDFIRLGSTMHMTNAQLAEAGEQFSKIVAGGKASQEDLNVMINRFPMFGEAIQKATGKSMKQLQQLSQQGKLTSEDFVKAMDYLGKKYKSGQAEAMTSYMGMSMYLKSRFSKLAGDVEKSNFRMSKSAKNAMVQVTSDHAMEQYAKAISSALAGLAGALSKTIVWIHKHQTATKTLIGVTAGLVIFHKVAGWVTGFYGLIGRLIIAYKGYTSATESAMVAQKMLNLAMKSNVILLVVSAIAALVVALVQLYKHNKKFRTFVNGIGRGLKNMAKGFVNTGRNILKGATNLHKKLSRSWSNYWKEQERKQRVQQKQEAQYQAQSRKQDQQAWNAMKRNAANGWKSMEQSASNGAKRVGSWYSNMSRTTGRAVQNMARNHPRAFGDMYKVIQDRTRTWHDLVTGHWSRLKDDTGRLAKDQSRANKDIFEDMYSAINKKTGGWLGKVVDSWKDHMSQIGDAISAGRQKAGRAMADLANGVLKPFKTLIDDIQGGINWVLDKIGASKLGGSWSAAIPTFATGTTGNPDGLKKSTIGMVNDGSGSHWRELYSYKGQIGAFPNKRNFITFLPKGMSILNGEDSHKFMSAIGLPRFANGIGDFFASLKDDVDDWTNEAEKIMAHPIQFMEHVFTKKLSGLSSGIKLAQSMITNVPVYVAKQMANWVKQQFETLDSAMNPNGTSAAPTGDHKHWMKQAGIPESWYDSINYIVTHESGWRVNATNPSSGAYGLPQSLPGSKMASAGRDWRTNPITQLKWMKSYVGRYGGGPGAAAFWRAHHWYANGGLVDKEQLIHVAEGNRPEMIIPLTASKRGRAYQLLSEVMAQFKHEDGPAQPTRDDQSISRKEFMSLESKLDQLISGVQQLVQVGQQQIDATINSGNKFGMKANRSAAYTVMARDQRLNDYMSYRR
ncbi:Phage tail length tape-measure protein [Limosilactobacillus reuteri]|uniref:Phage tail length tape-measure protein n=1 Tax=Limosilactobacillus reuteri TaxID=1598 RepID=A0A0U5JY49_LIMRT|nr:Phage tail length tape-measure protein [Limosilactobacillus reuteri]